MKIQLPALALVSVLLFTQCAKNTFPPPADFPLGYGKTVSVPFELRTTDPIAVGLVFQYDFFNEDKNFYLTHKIPFDISVQCFNVSAQPEILLFAKTKRGQEITPSSSWSVPGSEWDLVAAYNSKGWATKIHDFKAIEPLKPGKYRCDFIDRSPPALQNYFIRTGAVVDRYYPANP